MIPHIDLNTLNAALVKHIRPKLTGVENFTIHDFRRTARTHFAALGVDLRSGIWYSVVATEGASMPSSVDGGAGTDLIELQGALEDCKFINNTDGSYSSRRGVVW